MDLPRTGSSELIYIQTPRLRLSIKGSADNLFYRNYETLEKEACLCVTCCDSYEYEFEGDPETVRSSNLSNAYIGEYILHPLFFEQQRYELIIDATQADSVEFWHENYNIRKRITPVGRNRLLLSGEINFGNDIGFSDFVIKLDGTDYLKLTLEVFPSKISYKDDYKAIVADVTSEVYSLVFDFLKKTYSSFDISTSLHSSPVEFFAIIRKIYDQYISAADMILRNPHHQLQSEHTLLASHKIKRVDNSTLRWLEKHPNNIIRSDNRYLVDRALAVKKYITFNTKENQFTKYMLLRTQSRLEQFRKQYFKLGRETDDLIIQEIDRMINAIHRRSNSGFMKDVDGVATDYGLSLVFGMAQGYRELYRCYLLLQHGLTITGSIFNVSVKDLAVLYEYWCFIKLNSLMKEKYKLVSQDIIKTNGNGLSVCLEKGQKSSVRYINPKNGEKIVLSYNPRSIDSPTVPQRPDNVLTLEKKGADTNYDYVFDAKYRIDPAIEGTYYYNTIASTPGPQVDDINSMHRYRDAIVYQKKAHPFERTMFGAYVLFPYDNETEYRGHRFYKSIEEVNIGGLPFLPSSTSLVSELLDDLIADSPDSAFERTVLPAGIESKLAKVDWSIRDVLVGTLRNTQQLDICLENNMYYVPVNKIGKDSLPIHYIAIYQSKEKYKSESGIRYYGEVRSMSIVKRSDITESPKDSDELYYCFDISSWQKLDRTIEPKEIRFVTMRTNMFLIKHSSQVSELSFKSEEQYRLFTELKRRTDAAVINDEDQTLGFEFDNARIAFDDGQILLLSDSAIIERCSIDEFKKRPSATIRRLIQRQQSIR